MALILAKWPKSGQNLGIRGHNIGQIRGQNGEFQVKIGFSSQIFSYFAWILAIMLGFGPFCSDLGHIAWIWAIWQNLGQNRPPIVAKALDGQRYPMPLCEIMWVCDGERGSVPEGADDLCLVCFEALGLNLSIDIRIKAFRL